MGVPPSEEEGEDAEDRVTFLRFALYPFNENKHEDLSDSPCMLVVTCALTLQEANDDWHRTAIFHTYAKCSEKSYKVIIDGKS